MALAAADRTHACCRRFTLRVTGQATARSPSSRHTLRSKPWTAQSYASGVGPCSLVLSSSRSCADRSSPRHRLICSAGGIFCDSLPKYLTGTLVASTPALVYSGLACWPALLTCRLPGHHCTLCRLLQALCDAAALLRLAAMPTLQACMPVKQTLPVTSTLPSQSATPAVDRIFEQLTQGPAAKDPLNRQRRQRRNSRFSWSCRHHRATLPGCGGGCVLRARRAAWDCPCPCPLP